MKTLAIELSSGRGSLAWFDQVSSADSNGGFTHSASLLREWPNDRKNSALFFENLQQTIQQFGLPNRIIVGLGPGSYAGIRIAVSAAIGLATTAGSELVGYPSVCAMATQGDDYAVVGDARRNSFFLVRICKRTVVGDYELVGAPVLCERLAALEPNLPVLSSDLLPQFNPPVVQTYPSAEILGQLAGDAARTFFGPPLEPIYLREANITAPKHSWQSRKG